MMSAARRSTPCPMDRHPFFFSIEFSYLRVPKKPRLAGAPEGWHRVVTKPLAVRTFIVQNGPAWS